MSVMAPQILGISIICSIVFFFSGANQRKHQSSTSLAFVSGIHRWPVDSPHKGPVTWKMFPFDDVIGINSCWRKITQSLSFMCQSDIYIEREGEIYFFCWFFMLWHREMLITCKGAKKLACPMWGSISWCSDWGSISSCQLSSMFIPHHRDCAKKHSSNSRAEAALDKHHPNLAIILPADVLTPINIRPSAHTVLTAKPHFLWWRHQIETFSALLAICAGNSPVTGEFPAQRPVTQSFDVFFDLCLNKRLSKQWWR